MGDAAVLCVLVVFIVLPVTSGGWKWLWSLLLLFESCLRLVGADVRMEGELPRGFIARKQMSMAGEQKR